MTYMYILFGNSQATTLHAFYTRQEEHLQKLFTPSVLFFAPRMGIKYDINYKYTFKIQKLQLLIIFVSVQLQD